MVFAILHLWGINLWLSAEQIEERRSDASSPGFSQVYEVPLIDGTAPSAHLFARFISDLENEQGWTITPANFPRVAIYLGFLGSSGIGPSPEVVKMTVSFLRMRGYSADRLALAAFSRDAAEAAGFYSGYSGCPLLTSETPSYFNENWYHESPLPPDPLEDARLKVRYPEDSALRKTMARRSHLPACLFMDDFYWINLTASMDDSYLGVRGAVASIALAGSSNTERFLNDETMAAAAAAQIMAVPELWTKRLFALVDLSSFQVAGGPDYNAEYRYGKEFLLLGNNPFALDYRAMEVIGEKRKQLGMDSRKREDRLLFSFARQLQLFE